MGLEDFWVQVATHPISTHIGGTWWFPFLESIHVLGAVTVVGAILTVDLRLLGLAARRYDASRVVKELVPWSQGAFVVAVLTGLGLFVTRADGYMGNPAFQTKLVLLALAGVNIAVFHLKTFHSVGEWERAAPPPFKARVTGAASLFTWMGVLLAGRWIGHLL
jgi:hypothetical protein